MITILDAHHHYGNIVDVLGQRPPSMERVTQEEWERVEYRVRLAIMETNAIHQAVIMPSNAYLRPDGIRDTRRVNDGVAAYCRQDPARFPAGIGVVEPLHGERSLAEIDRIKRRLGLRGVVWHPRLQGVYLDNHWVRSYLRRMAELDLVPFFHTNAQSRLESPWRLQRLAEEFPSLTFVALDPFSSYEQAQECFHIAERTPNIVFDTAGAHSWEICRSFVRRFGPERLLFGSDLYSYPMHYRTSPLLGEILGSDLPDSAKEAILGGNVRRLLGLGE